MKTLLVAAVLLSSTAFAGEMCSRWRSNARYDKALTTLANHMNYSMEEMCNLPQVLDIEVQPSRVINPEGEVIPHVRIELHRAYDSCFYMIRDLDQVITSSRCYSTF